MMGNALVVGLIGRVGHALVDTPALTGEPTLRLVPNVT
jgi:hypothetical protein